MGLPTPCEWFFISFKSFTWQAQQHSCSAHLSQSLLPTCFKFYLCKCVWVCVPLFVCVFECVENQLAALLETNSCLHSSRTCFMHRNTLGSRKWRCQLVAQTYEEQSRLPHSAPLSLFIRQSPYLTHTRTHAKQCAVKRYLIYWGC